MINQICVRSAHSDDCEGIIEAWESAGLGFDSQDLILGEIEFPLFVAVNDHDEVLGAIEGHFELQSEHVQRLPDGEGLQAWVFSIGVAAAVQRQGVGAALLSAFARAALDSGCTYVALRTQDDDDVAARRAFFLRRGFEIPYPEEDTLAIGLLTEVLR